MRIENPYAGIRDLTQYQTIPIIPPACCNAVTGFYMAARYE